jgi:hypothetical protein
LSAEIWQIELARDGYIEARNPPESQEFDGSIDDLGSMLRDMRKRNAER